MKQYFRLNFFLFLLTLFALIFASCKNSHKNNVAVNRSIYYWKSVFKLSDFERQRIDSLHINTIYLKLFDVDWNDVTKSPTPVAQVRIADKEYLQQKNVIPTIFITNECIYKIDSTQTDSTAHKILRLVKEISTINNFKKIQEVQIDCDWTATTKEKHFSLLRTLQSLDTTISYSATIRLHQVKFMAKTGVPPVSKGLLMCYNMGNLKNPSTKNSIIETAEIKKYIESLSVYPLPLDVGMPLFEWNVLLRKGSFAGLMENLPAEILAASVFSKKDNLYNVLRDTTVSGYALQKGDVVRNEQSQYDVVMEAVKIIRKELPKNIKSLSVSLYHLDSLTLSKYSLHEMENIYDGMR